MPCSTPLNLICEMINRLWHVQENGTFTSSNEAKSGIIKFSFLEASKKLLGLLEKNSFGCK